MTITQLGKELTRNYFNINKNNGKLSLPFLKIFRLSLIIYFSGDGWSSTWQTEPEYIWMGGKFINRKIILIIWIFKE